MTPFDDENVVRDIFRYHEKTKHHYQSLYHFTIGRPVEDPRLTTYPPYHHLSR